MGSWAGQQRLEFYSRPVLKLLDDRVRNQLRDPLIDCQPERLKRERERRQLWIHQN